jgi:hypothetical protein
MIQNQESLLDEYRKSIEEEVSLEREFLRSEFEEKKVALEMEFNRVLAQMEKQQQERLRKTVRQHQMKDYQAECRELRKYLASGSRACSEANLLKPLAKPMKSEYSTNDQENRHNQPVFFL